MSSAVVEGDSPLLSMSFFFEFLAWACLRRLVGEWKAEEEGGDSSLSSGVVEAGVLGRRGNWLSKSASACTCACDVAFLLAFSRDGVVGVVRFGERELGVL